MAGLSLYLSILLLSHSVSGFAPFTFPPVLRHRTPLPRSCAPLASSAQATSFSFSPSSEQLEPKEVQLHKEWFRNWGFAEPEPPKSKQIGMGGMGAGGAKGKKGKKGPARSAANSKLFIKAPDGDLVTVFRADRDESAPACSEEDLAAWGAAARQTFEGSLDKTGAVLLRGLPMRNAEEFGHFWRGCVAAEEPKPLVEGRYNSMGPSGGRKKLSGIDMATNVPPAFLLLCHNEMCYNPTTVGRICLYCVQDAPLGGESLIARNSDLGKSLPKSVSDFVKKHGGILYSREYYDAQNPPKVPPQGSGPWQTKCSLPEDGTKEQAIEFFKGMGFTDDQMEWDEEGGLKLTNQHPGFYTDPTTGEDLWWNIIHTGNMKAADGTPFPKKVVADIQRTGWEHTYAFKLRPGDWLVCDNIRVQHGRLPYLDDARQQRCLLTVYSDPMPST
mmetsp:Transcript_556/g.1256  ORF Transcript_556/g.1256 Transcript_556/m.1256 type:complete len:443 (-) Transcript_556:87-1415(-)